MNCPSNEQISRYGDGELAPEERKRIGAHLRSCRACGKLYGELKGVGEVLRLYLAREEASPLERRLGCPEEETIEAYVDGSVIDTEERRRIGAHLAECVSCARKADEAAESVRLVEEAGQRGLEEVPARLAARVRQRIFPYEPALLGRVAASVQEVLARVRRGAGLEPTPAVPAEAGMLYGQAAYAAELREAYRPRVPAGEGPPGEPGGEEKTGKGARRAGKGVRRPRKSLKWSFERTGLRVLVRLHGSRAGTVRCTIALADESGRPLTNVRVALEEMGQRPRFTWTGRRGGASFRGLLPGRYRIVVLHKKPAYLDISLV